MGKIRMVILKFAFVKTPNIMEYYYINELSKSKCIEKTLWS